jgi:hypothetical protein
VLRSVISATSLRLKWHGAADDVAVAGYRIYAYSPPHGGGGSGRGGGYRPVHPATYTPLMIRHRTSCTLSGLTPNSTHRYAVAAFDAAGNLSHFSNVVVGTTLLPASLTWYPGGIGNSPIQAAANQPLAITLHPTGNPTPTVSAIRLPGGAHLLDGQTSSSQLLLTDPTIIWTPTDQQIGVHHVKIQVLNIAGGETVTISITVVPADSIDA